jgi:hypothetical protein
MNQEPLYKSIAESSIYERERRAYLKQKYNMPDGCLQVRGLEYLNKDEKTAADVERENAARDMQNRQLRTSKAHVNGKEVTIWFDVKL